MSFRALSMVSRRSVAVLGLAALITAATGFSAYAQTPATPAPQTPPAGRAGQTPAPAAAAPAQATAPQIPFTGDAGLILFTVKAENAADFETAMAKFKEALEKSAKPEYKQVAAGWKLFKGTEGAEPGQVLYVAMVDPAVKSIDYDPRHVITEVFPTEAVEINKKFLAALTGVNKLNLVKPGGM